MAKKQNPPESEAAKKSGLMTNPIQNQIITAVISLALGVAFLVQPYFIRDYCGLVIGGLLCATGLVYIILYFARRMVPGVYRTEFAAGSLLAAAGTAVIVSSVKPDAAGISITLRLIVTVLGILMAADGALKLQYALDLARMGFSAWGAVLSLSLIGVALGVLTALGLVDTVGVRLGLMGDGFLGAMLMLGAAFCCNGLLDVGTAILVAVRNRSAAKAEAAAAAAPTVTEAAASAPETPSYSYYDPSVSVTPPADSGQE